MLIISTTDMTARALYIVRHGNTFDKGDIIRRVGARTDLPLSTSGVAQAERLGAALAARLKDLDVASVYSSDLKRTRMTAVAINAALGRDAPTEIISSLMEIDYGPDEGAPETDVVARLGEAALAAWERDAAPPPGWRVDPQALIQNWRALFADFAAAGDDRPAILVTSNGVARFALDAADEIVGTPPRKLRTGAYGRVDLAEGGRVILAEWDIRPPSD